MDAVTTLLLPSSLADAWRVGYPLLIGVGALAAWTSLRLALTTDPKLRFFFPSLSNGALLTIDLVLSLGVALIAALYLFHPTTPLAAFTAGFTWTAGLELVARPKRSHVEFVRDRERITVDVAIEEVAS